MIKKVITPSAPSSKSVKEKREVNVEQKEILKMCRKCYSFGYAGGWHFEKPDYLSKVDMDEEISIQFSQCPACVEESLAMYDMEYV